MPRRSACFAWIFTSVPLALACSGDRQGELIVVVTTDMAVPNDFNRIEWSVTLPRETRPFRRGSRALQSNRDFPATLSVLPGELTTEPVTIRIEGWLGEAEESVLRVARDARIAVTGDATKELLMPLEWLCSDANSGTGCPIGQTCQAGTCVDAAIESISKLADYAESMRDCFDVTACFPEGRPLLPERNAKTGRCELADLHALRDANVNLALIVETSAVGAYGFCRPNGACLIPLDRDTNPGGWQALAENGRPLAALPDAICENDGRSVSALVAAPIKPGCPGKSRLAAPCAAPAPTCLEANTCPEAWPKTSWRGYACTGNELPAGLHPEVAGCWPPGSANAAPIQDGRWCCVLEKPPPSDDPLLIDDMSGGSNLKLEPPEEGTVGVWFTWSDGYGEFAPPLDTLFTYRRFTPPVRRDAGHAIEHAACLRSDGFEGSVALEGFHFLKTGDWSRVPLDMGPYAGISFWGRSFDPFDVPLTVHVGFANVQTCTAGGRACGGDFRQSVDLDSDFQKFEVRFDELRQPDWVDEADKESAFDPRVYATTFTVLGPHSENRDLTSQPFDFCISDIRFIEKSSGGED